jgi:pimeloyl-ACP methyl ester carboxylesterase
MDHSRRTVLAGAVGLSALAVETGTACIVSQARAAGTAEAVTGPMMTGESAAAPEPFFVWSSDGTMLAGGAQGDPHAPEIWAVNEGFVATVVSDLEPVFRKYTGPILLTHGVHDRLVRLAMSERIRALHQDSRLSVYGDSGHSPFYEEPVRFGQELAAFVTAATNG